MPFGRLVKSDKTLPVGKKQPEQRLFFILRPAERAIKNPPAREVFFMSRVRPGAGSRERNELAPGIRGIMTGIKTGGTRNLKGFGMPGGGNEPCNADSVECG